MKIKFEVEIDTERDANELEGLLDILEQLRDLKDRLEDEEDEY